MIPWIQTLVGVWIKDKTLHFGGNKGVVYWETPLITVHWFLFLNICFLLDFPVMEVVYGAVESWSSSPEWWDCLQQTLNFISHSRLGWAGTGIKSSSQEQLLKAGYKSLRGEWCGHFPSAWKALRGDQSPALNKFCPWFIPWSSYGLREHNPPTNSHVHLSSALDSAGLDLHRDFT